MSRFFEPLPRAMGETDFIERFGAVYENSPWVAAVLARNGLDSSHDHSAGLALGMSGIVEQAGPEKQLELLRAHPDLAGRAAQRGELGAASRAEQASAALDRCTAEELRELTELNIRYREKFGFPFIIAVRGLERSDIIEAFRRRVDNDRDTEFAEALQQVHRIARLRLDALAASEIGQKRFAGHPFLHWVNLATPRLGSRVVEVSDEFFAACERMLQDQDPVFIADRYDNHGKWMDGWESRRRRDGGHDHCVIRLGQPGEVHGVEIDTRFFTGNYPPEASLQGCSFSGERPPAGTNWQPLLPRVRLHGDRRHFFAIEAPQVVTHVRLSIFPDGGIARLRLFGAVRPDWPAIDTAELIDLVAVEHGGRALCCSDEHYGSMQNLNMPGRGCDMGDGWETARRRGPGHDWVILQLGTPGVIEQVEIDTAHFKGNYPARVSLQCCRIDEPVSPTDIASFVRWQSLLPESALRADHVHRFDIDPSTRHPATHVRMNIYPDGGISRLRLRGRPVSGEP